MATEIRVPALGESVTEATIGKWFKKPGDAVKADEPLVELETDKVTVEVPAPAAGVLSEIAAKEGDTVNVGAKLGAIDAGASAAASNGSAEKKSGGTGNPNEKTDTAKPIKAAEEEVKPRAVPKSADDQAPSVRRLAAESGVSPPASGTGKDGRVTKGDMLSVIQGGAQSRPAASAPSAPAAPRAPSAPADVEREERVRMTRLRQTIARRLKDAQNTAALLTTYNDVDMTAVMELRSHYKDDFEKRHGVKLGFMGLFTKACVHALKEVPAVNAEIDGDDLVFKNYYHMGIAVGTERGLVVPVVRDVDKKTLPEIERAIVEAGKKAREGHLGIEDMQGGTFTISNGGVYGSLMSMPILNAPQSGILGMHRIEQRPVVRNGEIVARPMMYLALTYDHRVVDGQGAVTFLVKVKEALEDPARLVLDL
ncbi:dihydrolipoyllysine-residue succinyltransferase component of 2-oxoglutarate dehydrogenase complex [Terrihabitans soli]|uniref:Dihydrolipoyllysine-residue succinyltransferase component of 2-oxoglutarate dehydrogenase complex n=1 Tax=Terrihabitans soli TaxID=708113 RepID=A0A6S6QKM2_9HYPH|nr:2-oxoglutarate dehydrogenase complex dihydrolipoyllysine-residue succinyltransferase [Terrihabitans soli]BCJ89439.1 dihydrolipoyllysine-residue succinyltransferase component of 2-oxoglutarate dehydrogenase complex [Terrihabitans soli]